jgi:uncharacterized protein YcnI
MTPRPHLPILALLAGALFSSAASAHVTVWPQQSAPGAREKYELRVPNERRSATITIEVRFPQGLRVTAVEQKPGWQAEAIRDSSGALSGVRWIGNLPPEQFTEFGLLAVNPKASGDLVFTAIQAFADGMKVEWSGAAGSKTPAARVKLGPRVSAQERSSER